MGVGDALGSIFGGGNDFSYSMPPNIGAPRQPGETDEQYANRIYQGYQSQVGQYQTGINQAMGNKTIPQNVLNFDQANQTAGQQNALSSNLQGKMGQNINFGTQGSMGQQQGLIDQILAQGRGEGPNPALDQLRMTTDQNAKQAASMAASQRGVNPALAARLASQGVAGANQQATGQAALQSAQQQLGAQQLGGGLLGQQIGQQTQQAGMNEQQKAMYAQLLAGQLGQQRQQDIGQATAQGGAGLNLLTANTNAEAIRRQSQLAYQKQIADIFNSMNATNAGVASQNSSQNFQFGMGAMSGLSSSASSLPSMLGGGAGAGAGGAGMAGMALMAEGGEVPNPFQENVDRKNMKLTVEASDLADQKKNKEFERMRRSKGTSDEEKMYMDLVDRKNAIGMADGGMANFLNYQQDPMAAFYGQLGMAGQAANNAGEKAQQKMSESGSKLGSSLGQKLHDIFASKTPIPSPVIGETQTPLGGYNATPVGGYNLGDVPSSLMATDPMSPFSSGGKIDGKASFRGDSKKNDTVPAMLSPGEIVIPRSATSSPEDAHAFLDQIISRHEGPNYKGVMKAQEKYHKMAHGGEMYACPYCHGGYT